VILAAAAQAEAKSTHCCEKSRGWLRHNRRGDLANLERIGLAIEMGAPDPLCAN
jgi:hypothetical protein